MTVTPSSALQVVLTRVESESANGEVVEDRGAEHETSPSFENVESVVDENVRIHDDNDDYDDDAVPTQRVTRQSSESLASAKAATPSALQVVLTRLESDSSRIFAADPKGSENCSEVDQKEITPSFHDSLNAICKEVDISQIPDEASSDSGFELIHKRRNSADCIFKRCLESPASTTSYVTHSSELQVVLKRVEATPASIYDRKHSEDHRSESESVREADEISIPSYLGTREPCSGEDCCMNFEVEKSDTELLSNNRRTSSLQCSESISSTSSTSITSATTMQVVLSRLKNIPAPAIVDEVVEETMASDSDFISSTSTTNVTPASGLRVVLTRLKSDPPLTTNNDDVIEGVETERAVESHQNENRDSSLSDNIEEVKTAENDSPVTAVFDVVDTEREKAENASEACLPNSSEMDENSRKDCCSPASVSELDTRISEIVVIKHQKEVCFSSDDGKGNPCDTNICSTVSVSPFDNEENSEDEKQACTVSCDDKVIESGVETSKTSDIDNQIFDHVDGRVRLASNNDSQRNRRGGDEHEEPCNSTQLIKSNKAAKNVESILPTAAKCKFTYSRQECAQCFCHFCQQKFASLKSFQTHLLKLHKDLAPFTCSYCGRNFFTFFGVVVHRNMVHPNFELTFYCRHCDSYFENLSTLNQDLNKHDFTLPLACLICYFHFDRKTELETHERRVHGLKKTKIKTKKRTDNEDDKERKEDGSKKRDSKENEASDKTKNEEEEEIAEENGIPMEIQRRRLRKTIKTKIMSQPQRSIRQRVPRFSHFQNLISKDVELPPTTPSPKKRRRLPSDVTLNNCDDGERPSKEVSSVCGENSTVVSSEVVDDDDGDDQDWKSRPAKKRMRTTIIPNAEMKRQIAKTATAREDQSQKKKTTTTTTTKQQKMTSNKVRKKKTSDALNAAGEKKQRAQLLKEKTKRSTSFSCKARAEKRAANLSLRTHAKRLAKKSAAFSQPKPIDRPFSCAICRKKFITECHVRQHLGRTHRNHLFAKAVLRSQQKEEEEEEEEKEKRDTPVLRTEPDWSYPRILTNFKKAEAPKEKPDSLVSFLNAAFLYQKNQQEPDQQPLSEERTNESCSSETLPKEQLVSQTLTEPHIQSDLQTEPQALEETPSQSPALAEESPRRQTLLNHPAPQQTPPEERSQSQTLSKELSQSTILPEETLQSQMPSTESSQPKTVQQDSLQSETPPKSQSQSQTHSEPFRSQKHPNSQLQTTAQPELLSQPQAQSVPQILLTTETRFQNLSDTCSEPPPINDAQKNLNSLSQTRPEYVSFSELLSEPLTLSDLQCLPMTSPESSSFSQLFNQPLTHSTPPSFSQLFNEPQILPDSESLSKVLPESPSVSQVQVQPPTQPAAQSLAQTLSQPRTQSELQPVLETELLEQLQTPSSYQDYLQEPQPPPTDRFTLSPAANQLIDLLAPQGSADCEASVRSVAQTGSFVSQLFSPTDSSFSPPFVKPSCPVTPPKHCEHYARPAEYSHLSPQSSLIPPTSQSFSLPSSTPPSSHFLPSLSQPSENLNLFPQSPHTNPTTQYFSLPSITSPSTHFLPPRPQPPQSPCFFTQTSLPTTSTQFFLQSPCPSPTPLLILQSPSLTPPNIQISHSSHPYPSHHYPQTPQAQPPPPPPPPPPSHYPQTPIQPSPSTSSHLFPRAAGRPSTIFSSSLPPQGSPIAAPRNTVTKRSPQNSSSPSGGGSTRRGFRPIRPTPVPIAELRRSQLPATHDRLEPGEFFLVVDSENRVIGQSHYPR